MIRSEIAPVLLIVFNRPEVSRKVFNSIREAKPKRLFIAADGPRSYKIGEDVLCADTRSIIDMVDWDCEVKTLFQNTNLGCKVGPYTAINWFFSYVDEGIILEDDCLPDPTFFTFCSTLLDKYRNTNTVMHISGTAYTTPIQTKYSYRFSGFAHIWGWATWRRAWMVYDINMSNFSHNSVTHSYPYFNRQILLFIKLIKAGYLDAWDVQWLVAVRSAQGLSIIPNVSLIRNIGFDFSATHTVQEPAWLDEIVYGEISEIVHPEVMQIDRVTDEQDADRLFKRSWFIYTLQEILWPLKFYFEKSLTFLTRSKRAV